MNKLKGAKLVHIFESGEFIVGITVFQGRLIVATDRNLYQLANNKLVCIKLKVIWCQA